MAPCPTVSVVNAPSQPYHHNRAWRESSASTLLSERTGAVMALADGSSACAVEDKKETKTRERRTREMKGRIVGFSLAEQTRWGKSGIMTILKYRGSNVSAEDKDLLDFKAPPVDTMWALTAPLRAYFPPRFYGMENIRSGRKLLFIGNHTIFGMLDAPLMLAQIYRDKGLCLRSLGDKAHFTFPFWRDLLTRFGVFNGSRENCEALMVSGAPILIFPGGGREVMKRKGEAYKLIWKQRTGFARLAIRHGYDIVPFASVGADDAYTIHLDANDFMASPLGKLLQKTGLSGPLLRDGELIPPIASGIGPLPRSVPFYFSFGRPIRTDEFAGLAADPEALMALRGKAERSIERQIKKLLKLREEAGETPPR